MSLSFASNPFGLSLSKRCSRSPVRPEVSKDRAEVSKPFTSHPFGLNLSKPCFQSGGGFFDESRCRSVAAAGDSLFFCFAKSKVSKRKGDPTVCVGFWSPNSPSRRLALREPCLARQRNWRLTPITATCGARSSRGRARTRFAQTIARPVPSGPALLGAFTRGGSEFGFGKH